MMKRLLKVLFFGFVIKPLVLLALGLNIRNRKLLPLEGPGMIAANHNSHLDAIVLMSLFPLNKIHKVRPVAAADYFLSNRLLAWFALNVMDIIPLKRTGFKNLDELFAGCYQALEDREILIVFPEGTRGQPEQMGEIKRGLFHLLKKHDDAFITPVVMYGLGRALPRGEGLFVPYNCDVIVGERLPRAKSSKELVELIAQSYDNLFPYCLTRREMEW